jgi:hypothetical protein
MLVYMVYDKSSGKILHTHRAVDVAGRSSTCTQEEILRVLPQSVDPKKIGIVSTEMDQVPSARQSAFSVDVKTGALIEKPVANEARK